MEFYYAHDTVRWTPALGKTLDLIVMPPGGTAGNVPIKLMVDDKDLPLEVGDKVEHGGNDMIITAVIADGTYGIGGDGAGLAFAGGITRAELTLVEGKRTVPKVQLSLIKEKLMTNRVSLPPQLRIRLRKGRIDCCGT